MHKGVGDYLAHGILGVFWDIGAPPVAYDHARLCVAADKGKRVLDDLVDGALESLRVQETRPVLSLPDLCASYSYRSHAEVGVDLLGIISETHESRQGRLAVALDAGQREDLIWASVCEPWSVCLCHAHELVPSVGVEHLAHGNGAYGDVVAGAVFE